MKFAILLVGLIVATLSSLLFFSLQANAVSPKNMVASRPDQSSGTMRFVGTFTNTNFNVSGDMTITVTINDDDTIEGDVEFSQLTSGGEICGGGDFTGTKSGDQLELTFTSQSNPTCGFNQDVTFTIEAALLNNTIIRGDYLTDTGEQGIVELRRVFGAGLFIPSIIRQED